ncbi:RNA processing protein [Babesia ovis]|uniref:RNA processing protein n=1 Tax=Babesia ovis TaxID=5869 RepID=A0A9W5T8U7_BABOV|nr:RNA processing protein [Babesia ovis]
MRINFVLCNSSLELYRDRASKRRSLPHSFSLLNEEDHFRESISTEPAVEEEDSDVDSNNATRETKPKPTRFRRRNWKEVRPDILHFCLLAINDSILNKEKHVQIWVHTLNSQIYRFNPEFRIPRTFKVFNKVMAKYLHSNAKCLKPEGDDSTVFVERTDMTFDDLGKDGVRIAVSSRGRPTCAETFFNDILTNKDKEIWIFISLSNHTHLPVSNESGVLCVADVLKHLTDRMTSTPTSSTYSQELELELLEDERKEKLPDVLFDYNVSIASCYPSAMSTCYKLACAVERVMDL